MAWHCSECQVGGDVLDLYALAKGFTDKEEALLDLTVEVLVDPSCNISAEVRQRLHALFHQLYDSSGDHERR
jgi:hypothetical protein